MCLSSKGGYFFKQDWFLLTNDTVSYKVNKCDHSITLKDDTAFVFIIYSDRLGEKEKNVEEK